LLYVIINKKELVMSEIEIDIEIVEQIEKLTMIELIRALIETPDPDRSIFMEELHRRREENL
jgi:hypothetical protein